MTGWSFTIGLIQRYPPWRAWALEGEPEPRVPVERKVDGEEVLSRVGRVFVARSGAWVPPWADEAFFSFIEEAPWPKVNLDGVGKRPFDLEALRKKALEDRYGLFLLGLGPGQMEKGGL